MEDRCVMCGEIIPEGRQICPICEKGEPKVESLKWISVKDRLPDTFGEYIVAVQAWEEEVGNLYADYADYDPYIRIWRAGYGLGERDKITHWMPLPEPPKGE